MTQPKRPSNANANANARHTNARTNASATNASVTNAVLKHSTLPTLVFAAPITAAAHDADVVDLRALDLPVSELALRNTVRAAWIRSPLLTVRVDGAPSAQVLALLHGLVRGELRYGPTEVERFDDHRVVALTDAHAPSPALLALFMARVRDSGRVPTGEPGKSATATSAQKSGSPHAR